MHAGSFHCTGHLLRRVNFRTADQRHFTSKPIRDGRRHDVGWLRCHLRHYMEPTELAPGSRRRAQVQTFTSSDTLPGIKMPVTHHLLNTSRPRDTPPNLSPRYTKAVHALTANHYNDHHGADTSPTITGYNLSLQHGAYTHRETLHCYTRR